MQKWLILVNFGMLKEYTYSTEIVRFYAILSAWKKALTCYFSEGRALKFM